MASRSGGYRIKTNKVRSGPDQAFTLPKGTSAAPIKGKGMGNPPKSKKATPSAKSFIARRQQLAGTKKAKNVKITPKEIAIGVAAYLAGSGKLTKAKKPTKGKTLAQIEAQERKKRDRKAKFERLKKDLRGTGVKPFSLLKKKR